MLKAMNDTRTTCRFSGSPSPPAVGDAGSRRVRYLSWRMDDSYLATAEHCFIIDG